MTSDRGSIPLGSTIFGEDMNEELFKAELFECVCRDTQHIFAVYKDEDSTWIELQTHPGWGFFRRIREAFRYLCRADELAWADVLLREEDIPRLVAFLQND